MGFRLRFFGGEYDGQTYLVDERRGVTLGRSPGNSIYVRDQNVSRVHARIHVLDGQCLITDMQSTNGTFVGGRRVTETQIYPGDEIRIGLTTMRLEHFDDKVGQADTEEL